MNQQQLDLITHFELLCKFHQMMTEMMIICGSDGKTLPKGGFNMSIQDVINLHGISLDLCNNWDRIIANSAPPHAGIPKQP